jgi:hypothetical protein
VLSGRTSITSLTQRVGGAATAALVAGALALGAAPAKAQEAGYPRAIHLRYEAVDAKAGGNFVIWLEREKVWHGLDPRLYPAVKYVDVTHLTPAPGSPALTIVEVMSVNSTTPEFYHIAGIVRFKVTGMTLRASNIPKP